jgi:hypothetical protein
VATDWSLIPGSFPDSVMLRLFPKNRASIDLDARFSRGEQE